MKKNDFLIHHFEKRKSLILKYLILFLLLTSLFWSFHSNKKNTDFIAKVHLDGVISDRFDVLEKLDEIYENENLKGLLLITNSPGGTFVSSKEIFDSLKKISEKVPTTTYIREVGTSGAYLASLGTEKIFVNNGTITGSIGVILQSADLTSLLENLGIQPVIVKSGELKTVPNPLEKIDDEKLKYMNNIINQMQNQFVNLVKERRNLNQSSMELISDGRIFTGEEAKKINLVDFIGNERDAINWIKNEGNLEENIEIIEFNNNENFLNFLNSSLLKKTFKTFNLNINSGILAIWMPGL